jgi:GntR family transcriptional regulator
MARETTIPYYYRVAETLKGRIASRKYPPGGIVPSEKQLAEEFGVSNITIRKAMALLVEDGLVIRRRGIGTRVISKQETRIPLKITGNFRDWVDSAVGQKQRLKVDVLEIAVARCPQSVAKIFSTAPDSKIWRMKRIRKLNAEPISYYINHVPPELLTNVTAQDFEKGSFIDVFERSCGIKIAKIEQRVEATTADMDVSSILGTEFGDPLFFIENIYYTADLSPVEVTHMYFRGDRYIYKSDIMLY